MKEALTFDDVLIAPGYSDIESRSEIDIGTDLFPNFHLNLPIISAPMDYVSGWKMVEAMQDNGGLGVLQRFQDSAQIYDTLDCFLMSGTYLSFAIGIRNLDEEFDKIVDISRFGNGSKDRMIVTIDVAHGHHQKVIEMIARLKALGILRVIAGNVATADGFYALQRAGADAIRVGIGPGSACSTRAVTGIGVPQLTAIMDCVQAQNIGPYAAIIADGGIKNSGDIVKALAAGADAVMLGNLLAGTPESPGEVTLGLDGTRYKPFRGMSSIGVNGHKYTAEGVAGFVKEKPPLADVLKELAGGIRSGLSYVGARNLAELRSKSNFIRVSNSTHLESATRLENTSQVTSLSRIL